MSVTAKCPECASPLRSGTRHDLCPACLIKVALSEPSGPPPGAIFSPVALEQSFGDFELLGELGRGGMGVVYEARQISLNRRVALKMILPTHLASGTDVERFRLEAETIANLDHPNILPVYDVGEFQGQRYFTMRLVSGGNLAERLAQSAVPPRTAVEWAVPIARAVHYAHQRGVSHRDLKPANILLDAEGRPFVSDFGLARLRDRLTDLTQSTAVLGSPAYMSPEQAAGDARNVTTAADIYGLGAILFFMLTRRPPFAGESALTVLREVMDREAVSPRSLNLQVDADLATICLKCLRKNPRDRYATAEAFADDLENWLAGKPIAARPVSSLERLQMWSRRSPALAALSTALILTCGIALGGILSQWRRAERHAEAEQHQRRVVEASEQRVRLNLYAADIKAASLAAEKGDFGLARQLLEDHRPQPDAPDLRGFEWRYLLDKCRGQQLATLAGHQWIVTCSAFSPDGQWLVTGSQDSTLRIWNIPEQRLATSIVAHAGAVWSVGFSRDGTELISAGSDRRITFRTAGSWKVVHTLAGEQVMLSPAEDQMVVVNSARLFWTAGGAVSLWNRKTRTKIRDVPGLGKSAAYSGDGQVLAVVHDKAVTLWAAKSGETRGVLRSPAKVWSVSLDHTGAQVAAAGRGQVFVWNHSHENEPAVLPHLLNVWETRFSPDGKVLATACSDRSVRMWNTETLALATRLHGHLDEVWTVAFSPDGAALASGGKDTMVMLWVNEAKVPPLVIPHTSWSAPFFSPDGLRLVTTMGTPQDKSLVTEIASGRRVELPAFVGFSPDGKHEVRIAPNRHSLEWWSGSNRVTEIALKGTRSVRVFHRLTFAPNFRFAAASQNDGSTDVFDAATGEILRNWKGPGLPLRASVISHDGQWLAASSEPENVVRLLNVRSGKSFSAVGHKDFPSGLAFTKDGMLLASGSMDGTVKMWRLAETGATEIVTFKGHFEEATDVSFAPDGRTLASMARHSEIRFWHVPTLRELMTLETSDAASNIQFSPDGAALVLTSGGNVHRSARLFRAPATHP